MGAHDGGVVSTAPLSSEGVLGVWGGRWNIAGTTTFFYIHSFPKRFQMNITQWLLAAAAVALISGTSTAMAQQDPPRTAPAEKVVPESPSRGANTPALPGGNTRGALKSGAATPDRKKTALEPGEGHRSGELQENRGRSETTGQAPRNERREPNPNTERKN